MTAIDRNGTILYRYPDNGDWIGKKWPDSALVATVTTQNAGTIEAQGLDGVDRLFGFSALGKTNGGAYVLVGTPTSVAFIQVNRLLVQNLASLGVIGLLTLVIAWYGVNKLMVRPTQSLVASTAKLAEGDLQARVDERLTEGINELHRLTQAFNSMADALERRQKELTASNASLAAEVAERKRAEEALKAAHNELEQRVAERTAELARANEMLQAEVTGRQQAENTAREQREQLQVTLSSIGDAVIATDRQGCVTFINPVAQALTGWSQAEAEGKKLSDVFHIVNESSREIVENPVTKVMREGKIVGLANHTLLIARHGREVPIDDSGAPILDAHGHISGVILVFRDITGRKQNEATVQFLAEATAILASSLDYETTLDQVVRLAVPRLADYCTVSVFQEDGSIEQVAAAHQDPEKAALVREFGQRYPVNPDAPHGSAFAIRTGQPEIVSDIEPLLSTLAPDERQRQGMVNNLLTSYMAVPLITRDRTLGAIVFTMAESGRRYTQDDLPLAEELARRAALAVDNARLYQQTQQAVRVRDEFLSVAAHELKTPVTSLRGFAQTLLRQLNKHGTLNMAQVQRALTVIDQQSTKLTALITQLLDLSRLEAGRLALERRETDIVQLANEVISAVQRTTTEHSLAIQSPPTLKAFVDPLRMEQVLVNLLDNAIRYSPDGGRISIEITLYAPQSMRISITDQGMGIPPERRARIFERFYQAHQEGYRGGMGLGLYVSRQIVEMHGGVIKAEFPDQGGTRFVIEIPLSPLDETL